MPSSSVPEPAPANPLSSQPALTVTLLGTGTSTGIPMIGCDCAVCLSSDPHNKRMRSSLLVEWVDDGGATRRILVDTTPEMRLQMLRAGVGKIDAVLITHTHADHIFGLDDLRQFNFRHGVAIPVYGEEEHLSHLRRIFSYCFQEGQAGGGKPQITLHPILPRCPLTLWGLTITPLRVLHGRVPVTAFRFGNRFAYVTDVSQIPDETRPFLHDLHTLVLDAVRPEPHPTHFGLGQALDEAQKFAPQQTFLTHLSHHFDHATTNATLPHKLHSVALGYDGQVLRIPGTEGKA